MPEPQPEWESTQRPTGPDMDPSHYLTNHVIGIVDTPDQATCAVDALTRAGFRESEIGLASGPVQADRLRAATGRTGFQDLVIRVAQSLGITHDELEVKNRYEQALRDGQILAFVAAPTEERKDRSAQIIRDCGGHFINFLSRFTREAIAP